MDNNINILVLDNIVYLNNNLLIILHILINLVIVKNFNKLKYKDLFLLKHMIYQKILNNLEKDGL